ncbi:trypsin-like peptidase domain-containing protein [Terrihabitans sp. B22-R8]|uniref:trypsin-like peptidase domain-containing protein n=1 Tax=Terrihabitans sp. B22-R8 TaxID=3425128 RepID=UPI00403D1755
MRRYVFVALIALVAFGVSMWTGEADAVTIGSDARLTLADFAAKTRQPLEVFESRYAATGMVVCSGVYSTAQLTIRNDVVTTAAHAFYGPDGNPRGDLSSCVFTIAVDGAAREIPLVVSSLKVGSRNPYAVSPVFDWAVVRLAASVPNARPYALGRPGVAGMPIVLLAHRHRGWVYDGRKAIEACAIRESHFEDRDSPREIAIDCSAGEGASGSAIMTPGATGSMVGIYVGWRSTHPETAGPYSETHMNFGVAVEGAFRSAILAVTKVPGPTDVPATTASVAGLR